jgi:hypothetical protein
MFVLFEPLVVIVSFIIHNSNGRWTVSKVRIVIRIRRSDTDPDPKKFLIADPDPGFDDLKFKKNCSWNLVFIFLIKNLLILRPP